MNIITDFFNSIMALNAAYLMLAITLILVLYVIISIVAKKLKIKKMVIIQAIIYSLVVQAEKALGSGTGEMKKAAVLAELYMKMPIIIKLLFTQKEMNDMIDILAKKLKEELSKGKNLLTLSEEIAIGIGLEQKQ